MKKKSTWGKQYNKALNLIDRNNDLLDELVQMKAWKEPRRLHLWSISRGFVDLEGKKIGQEDSTRPEQALQFLRKSRDPGLFVLKDFHPYLKDKAQNIPRRG